MDTKKELLFNLYENGTHEEDEVALVDEHGTVIFNGDYYHDKTSIKIPGFTETLKYFGYTFTINRHVIDVEHTMFDELNFYDGTEE